MDNHRYEEELTAPVELCTAGGRLNDDAVGYSSSLVHVPNLPRGPRGWGRNKRWEYWAIITPDHVIGVTIASLDYAGLVQLYLVDRRSDDDNVIADDRLFPLARGIELPDAVPPFVAGAGGEIEMRFRYGTDTDRLRLRSPRVHFDLEALPGGDVLAVVIPWSPTRFQYTVKDVARPIRGELVVDGETFNLDAGDCFAVLDRGRGRWPYRMTWNWAAGFGRGDDTSLGLQMGGKWTVDTPGTENALFVDGRLNYIDQELRWQYDADDPTAAWQIRGKRIDATLTPFHLRRDDTNALVVASRTRQAFGHWSGWAIDDDGQRHSLDGLVGFAEEAHNRW